MKIEKNIDNVVPKGFLALVKEEILLNINKLATEHEDNIISCSDIFLPYVSDKTKKNGGLFVCYFFFCLSLRQI